MNDMEIQSLNADFEQVNELLRIFARGEREISLGKGYDLEAVLAEADVLLAEKQMIPT